MLQSTFFKLVNLVDIDAQYIFFVFIICINCHRNMNLDIFQLFHRCCCCQCCCFLKCSSCFCSCHLWPRLDEATVYMNLYTYNAFGHKNNESVWYVRAVVAQCQLRIYSSIQIILYYYGIRLFAQNWLNCTNRRVCLCWLRIYFIS